MGRIKMPNGWRNVKWIDSNGKRWNAVVPTATLQQTYLQISRSGGRVITK